MRKILHMPLKKRSVRMRKILHMPLKKRSVRMRKILDMFLRNTQCACAKYWTCSLETHSAYARNAAHVP
jgi:hypothetical protein